MEPTDDEKYKNYLKLRETIEFLEKDGRITEDWMVEHAKLILKYREGLPNITMANPEIKDPTFRTTCSEAETLLEFLANSVSRTKTFDVKRYGMFVFRIKKICETLFTEDDLIALMEKMGL